MGLDSLELKKMGIISEMVEIWRGERSFEEKGYYLNLVKMVRVGFLIESVGIRC